MTWHTAIEEHYADVWKATPEACEFRSGPIGQLPSGFDVLRFPPHDGRKIWTYATRCMSLPEDENPIELHMFSPRQSSEVVEVLVATAHFHRTSAKLDLGHSVNFGRGWIDGSKCDHGLISLPYLDGPNLEVFRLGSKIMKFYWLIPITLAEVEFKKQHGYEALEVEFERSNFNYADPRRDSVV
jgi:hypothetical protein